MYNIYQHYRGHLADLKCQTYHGKFNTAVHREYSL